MPKVGESLPPRRAGGSVDSNNKVELPDGTRLAVIVEFWVYNCDKDGRFTKEETGEKKVRVKVRLKKRPDIVLDKRMRYYLSEKSQWSKFLEQMTGVPAEPDTADHPSAQRDIDTDDLILSDVLITTKYKEPYTDIVSMTAPPFEDEPESVPAHQPAPMVPARPDSAEIKERLLAKLRTTRLLKWEIEKAISTVTGDASPKSIGTPEKALRVIGEIDLMIAALDDEIPF